MPRKWLGTDNMQGNVKKFNTVKDFNEYFADVLFYKQLYSFITKAIEFLSEKREVFS